MTSSLTSHIEHFEQIVRRQGYETAYMAQGLPWIGPVVSIPTALVSGFMATAKICDLLWQHVQNEAPFPPPQTDATRYQVMNDAIDLGIIFVNNVLNILTGGLLNAVIILIVLSKREEHLLARINSTLPH